MTELQNYIGIIKPYRDDFISNPDDDEMKIMEKHFQYLQKLQKQGILYLAGPTLNEKNTFGVIILKAKSKDKAKNLLVEDPSIKASIQKLVELEPFKVSLYHT